MERVILKGGAAYGLGRPTLREGPGRSLGEVRAVNKMNSKGDGIW